jgi:hypothetical protein
VCTTKKSDKSQITKRNHKNKMTYYIKKNEDSNIYCRKRNEKNEDNILYNFWLQQKNI